MFPYNKSLVSSARHLRKNMTPEEKILWYQFLKSLPITVHRQHNLGNYIVDFYIAQKKLVIEIDGEQHFSTEHQQKDRQRDAHLTSLGISVLRYSNKDIRTNFDGVAQDILRHLGLSSAHLE
ncbi:MAG: endonuclease domain-containing protein [Clostridia bacterium]|nr:endonuclease domain-containing protein [Clostridia bacterium]